MAISMGFMQFYTVILMFFSFSYLLVGQENLLGIGEVMTVKAYALSSISLVFCISFLWQESSQLAL